MTSFVLLQGCGSSNESTQAEAPEDYPDYKVPEEATEVPDNVEPFTPKWYVERYKVYAIKEMKRTGIPASITLAQGMLESSYGKSKLAKEGNNHFGIKCHRGSWGGGEMYLADDRPNECFRTYETALQSFKDHSIFLTEGKRYQELFEVAPNNYKAWAEGLKDAGYATNPRYDDILIKLIKKHNLHYFDQFHNKPYKEQKLAINEGQKEDKGSNVAKQNGLKVYNAGSGQSLQKIAEQTNATLRELKSYNDFHDPYATVKKDAPVYLEPKKDKPAKSYHVVEQGESMWDIAQQYGVKVKKLYKRNRLDLYNQPPENERIFLRKVRYEAMPEREKPLPKPEKNPETANTNKHQPPEELPSYHAVQEGESMRDIAQRYDIQLNRLYKLNRLELDEQPAVGSEIHLKETRYIKPEVRDKPIKTQPSNQDQKTANKKNRGNKAGKDKEENSYEGTYNQSASKFENGGNKNDKASNSEEKTTDRKSNAVSHNADQENNRYSNSNTESAKTGASSTVNHQHTVKANETLYEIAKEYGVSVKQLKQWNKLKNATIEKGQELRVRTLKGEQQAHKGSAATSDKQSENQRPAYHTVQKGETLFGIAKQYKLSMETLKKRNDLTGNELKPGQRLKIKPADPENSSGKLKESEEPDSEKDQTHSVKKGETLFSIAKKYDVTVEAIKKANDLDTNLLDQGQELTIP